MGVFKPQNHDLSKFHFLSHFVELNRLPLPIFFQKITPKTLFFPQNYHFQKPTWFHTQNITFWSIHKRFSILKLETVKFSFAFGVKIKVCWLFFCTFWFVFSCLFCCISLFWLRLMDWNGAFFCAFFNVCVKCDCYKIHGG